MQRGRRVDRKHAPSTRRRVVYKLSGASAWHLTAIPTYVSTVNNVNTTQQNKSDRAASDSIRTFARWALAALDLPVETADGGCLRLSLPEAQRPAFHGDASLTLTFQPGSGDGTAELVAPGSRFFAWLLDQLRLAGKCVHAAPRDQPTSVHEITPQLFAPYKVEKGHAILAGCVLEDRPLLRLTFLGRGDGAHPFAELLHIFAYETGELANEPFLKSLHVDQLEPAKRRSRALRDGELENWISRTREAAERQLGLAAELVATTVVWCKYASGKLSFLIGKESVQTSFAGWARLLAEGREQPRPYHCPLTGLDSYRIAATDDGRITVAEAIESCAASGRRVLASELETCELTGRHALPEFLVTCPITGMRVLKSALMTCAMCGQDVSPSVVRAGRCQACREMTPVTKEEPRLARVLGEHPRLDQWRHWKIAETATVYILHASALIRRLLVVLDKETLQPQRLAMASRFLSGWIDVPPAEWNEFVG